MREEKGSTGSRSDAEFLGWQRTLSGETIALFNVTAEEHPLFHSTVSENTLRKNNLEVPQTPQGGEADHEK